MLRVAAIDPGINGGVACLEGSPGRRPALVDAIELPTNGENAKRRINVVALFDWLNTMRPDYCYIERAQAFKDQGSSSGFLYGRAVGSLEATIQCAGIPMCLIEASGWKKTLNLKGGDKEGSRQWVLHRFPEKAALFARKLDHNKAEAVCIAWCGLMISLTESGARAEFNALDPSDHPRV